MSPLLLVLSVGVFIRVSLFRTGVPDWLAGSREVSTPLHSWRRLTEGLALQKAGLSPYDGDLFHEQPLVLYFVRWHVNLWGPNLHLLFVALDLITALVLYSTIRHAGRHLLLQQAHEVMDLSPAAAPLLLTAERLQRVPLLVTAAYLLNPYTVVTCLAKSTTVLNNCVLACALLYAVKASRGRACVFLALASYTSLYPLMLVVPAALHIARHEYPLCDVTARPAVTSMLQTLLYTAVSLAALLGLSFLCEGSWQFLEATYGFILTVPDLSPNVGVFWYFFTEMFEHFRIFFICVFQINVFIYTVPLAITLKHRPLFLSFILLGIMTVFKSYPCYGDAALFLALLPLWRHVFRHVRNGLVVGCMLVVAAVLAPILWHLWIYAGSANANFYFAITLVYSTAQVFLITDMLFAFLRHEFDLAKGPGEKEID